MMVTGIVSIVTLGCGGGGSSMPPTTQIREDTSVDLPLPSDHGIPAGEYTVAVGTSAEQGNVVVSCPAGGSACVVSVAPDGTVTYDRTGGVPSVMAVEGGVLPFTLAPGTERQLSSGIFLVCPAGGASCEVESLTQDESGQFSVQLAANSGTPFYWRSSTGIFAGNLGPYDERLIMVVGFPETRRVTCVDSVPCDIGGLRFNEDGRLLLFPDTQHVHVSNDETGFFLRYGESKTVLDRDGREVLFTCPDPKGCGVNDFYISKRYTDDQGEEGVDYAYAFDHRWGEPTVSRVQDQMAGDDTMTGEDDTMLVDDDTMPVDDDTMPVADDTMPVDDDTMPVADDTMPVDDDMGLVHFQVTHWELADELFWLGDEHRRSEEVVCPGVNGLHEICHVEGKRFDIRELLEPVRGQITPLGRKNEGFQYFTTAGAIRGWVRNFTHTAGGVRRAPLGRCSFRLLPSVTAFMISRQTISRSVISSRASRSPCRVRASELGAVRGWESEGLLMTLAPGTRLKGHPSSNTTSRAILWT